MNSLQEIQKELDLRILNESFSDLMEIMDWFSEMEIEAINELLGFEDDSYCRIPLIENKKYDLLICCWKPGQESAFHGHPNQGCLVKIIQGTLKEEVKFTNGTSEIRQHSAGAVGYITDKIGIHRVQNATQENAVSLHLYAPGGYRPVFQ